MSTSEQHGEDQRPELPLGDWTALALQRLRPAAGGPGRGAGVLLRIDNRAEAIAAPFQFDAVSGTLHRIGCRAIPITSRTALYGLWRIGPEDARRACRWCRPVPDEPAPVPASTERADLLFGLLSVIDQFAGVLKERGQDYQRSPGGRQLSAQLDHLYQSLGQREKVVLDTVLSSLDQLVERIRGVDEGLSQADGAKADGDGAGG